MSIEAAAGVEPATELTDQHRLMLELEQSHWKFAAAKDSFVLETFGMTSWRYAQVLDWLIDQPAALAYDPITVHRLQRLRANRRSSRGQRS